MATRLDLSDLDLRSELVFFLSKELGLYGDEFKILDVVYLYTDKISGADYVLITFKAPDGNLCQITISRNFLPFAKWQLNPETFNVIEPIPPLLGPQTKVPQWMQNLGVTHEQLNQYYITHPDVALKGEAAFFDAKTGKYNLPSDWYESLFALEIKEKGIRLVPQTEKGAKTTMINSYWKADYPTDYLGSGYREYLYKKIKDRQN